MRDGIKANPEEVQALDQIPDCLQTQMQALRFLGVLNFNRRFISFELAIWPTRCTSFLHRKYVRESEWPWKPDATLESCCYKPAYKAVRESLRMMDVMLAHPDLHDP
eukprot:6176176-Pleurochrysis_carterae.AAC.1